MGIIKHTFKLNKKIPVRNTRTGILNYILLTYLIMEPTQSLYHQN